MNLICLTLNLIELNGFFSVIVTIPRVYRSLLTVHQFLNGFSNFSFKDMKKRIKR